MQVTVLPSKISGEINIPSSKSVAHRALICAFLSGEKVKISGDFSQDDVITTINCLASVGAKVERTDDGVIIRRTRLNEGCVVDANESGSTLRFIIPVISALGLRCKVVGSNRLANRPIGELLRVLTEKGERFSSGKLPFEQSGKIVSGIYEIDGSVSSQYITGLILALSYLNEDSEIIILNKFVSRDYVKITLEVLSDFGVSVCETEKGYVINNKGKFCPPKEYFVEGDWSSACFFACLGALAGEVTLKGLKLGSSQGDKIVIDTLKRIGARVEVSDGGIKIAKDKLSAIEFDAGNYPDLVPVLSAVLACCSGVSKIKNVSRLKDKESDRLSEVLNLLKSFGINAYCDNDCIVIEGGKPKGCVYNSPNDHRMTMSAGVLAIVAEGKTQINGAECIRKSYPSFFEHLAIVGGKVNV